MTELISSPLDGLTVSCDISNDEELFMGQGDYQFEIYRLMREENGSVLNPESSKFYEALLFCKRSVFIPFWEVFQVAGLSLHNKPC